MARDDKSSYYDAGGIETLDVIRAKLTNDQYIGYLLGNIIKYSCRYNFKGVPRRDAEKVGVYRDALLEAMDEQDREAGKELLDKIDEQVTVG